MILATYRSSDGHTCVGLEPQRFGAALQDQQGLLWVDLDQEAPENCEGLLHTLSGFHPVAIEDALHESDVCKIDDWGDYLYIVLHEITFDPVLGTQELDVFLGKNYLVTHHTEPIRALERIHSLCERDERNLGRGPSYLLYRLCDELATDYMAIIDQIDHRVDVLEDAIFDRTKPLLLQDIFNLKRALILLRSVVSRTREVVNRLARGDCPALDDETCVFFRDVYDQFVRLHDVTEGLRDVLTGALDTYLSVVDNRMNETMKTLTLIATLFMPLAVVVGFFGMNFFQPAAPLLRWTSGTVFVITLVAMVLVPVAMYLWMRKRAWM